MVTKLKNLISRKNRRGMEISLAVDWIVISMALTYASIFSNYKEFAYYWSGLGLSFYRIASTVLAVFSLVIGAAVLAETYFYLKNHAPLKKLTVCRADRVKTELLVGVLILSGGMWLNALISRDIYVWDAFMIVMDGVIEAIQVSIILLVVLICFYGSIILLIRQKTLGIMHETSIICAEIRRYKTRTPLELRIQRRNRTPLIVSCILAAIILIVAVSQSYSYGYMLGWFYGGLAILLFFVYLKTWIDNKTTREMGHLLRQIQAMSEGEEIPEYAQLSEKSLLYEASNQLKNIELAMRKSVEKQIQAERLKIDLITNVSHDLKTPLTSMVGYTDLLKKEKLSEEARDYVEIISLKQEQLKNMIQDLFELSKATSGADQLVMETLDMRKLLEQTMGDMEDAIGESGQEIRTRFSQEPLLFTGDNGKMYRVVQNLLENALKYSLPGTRIYLEAEKKGSRVEMQIKNIASYEMDFAPDEVMERFVRGDKSRTTEGHGLGLAIASSFVRNMGGNLEIGIDGDLFKVILRFPEAAASSGVEHD